jgi:hypothetical protein
MLKLNHLVSALGLFIVLSCSNEESLTGKTNPVAKDNIAYYWGKVALDATALDTERFNPRPTITSRYLGLIFTSVFDAWSVYDQNATPVYYHHSKKQKSNLRAKEIAVSYAAYRSLMEYYYSDSLYFKTKMEALGLDTNLEDLDPESAAFIGVSAAEAVIKARFNDGSNQYGFRSLDNKTHYADYTGYQPKNTPEVNTDINRWQPKYFISKDGEPYAPECLTPYWQNVAPITLEDASQFRSPPPPQFGSEVLNKEIEEVVELQSNLTKEQKGLVEFMRDGPKSVQQAGHWLLFAQELSVKRKHTLDDDVKMYFLNQIVAMDAFIASWDTKMFYDYARPYALVHEYFGDRKLQGWKGYGKGWGEMKGTDWRPYSPAVFLCPPFPSYVSGHSTVSGACAEALKLFTGSDEFDIRVPFVSGSYTEEESEWNEIELYFPTLTEAAEMAGFSRVLGGYHIQSDNIEGLILGRKVANHAYQFYLKHIGS